MKRGNRGLKWGILGQRMTDGFSVLAIEKVDGRREVLGRWDSFPRFLWLSGRSVLVELGGFPSVSRKTSDIFGKISHVFPKTSDVFVRISDVFVEVSDIFLRGFCLRFWVENSPDFSFLCEGCESKKCKSPGMRARVTRA